MKYKKYISTVFIAALLLPLLSAKSTANNLENLDLSKVSFVNEEPKINLGFSTKEYLPEDFNPYQIEVSIDGINFMENEVIDLGFDTSAYLPKGFNPYKK